MSRLRADLNHEDDLARVITVRNVARHFPEVTQAVAILRLALNNSAKQVRVEATLSLALLGEKLTREAIDDLEVACSKRSQRNDLAIRIVLLGHYRGKQIRSEAARGSREALVLWVIDHAPRSIVAGTYYAHLSRQLDGVAHAIGRDMWMKLVGDHPEDTVILENAASYLHTSDLAMAEEWMNRAASLEPSDPYWPQRLAELYRLAMIRGDAASWRALAAKAQAAYEKAQGLYRDERERRDQLPFLAEAAFEADDHANAAAYASELLSAGDTGRGDVFYGNQILGRVALAGGDVERAKSYLIASAETTVCHLMTSTFRGMALAKELLARGERETVLRFLKRCSALRPANTEWLDQWAARIERGETPIFAPWD
jgi:hypothetical protein